MKKSNKVQCLVNVGLKRTKNRPVQMNVICYALKCTFSVLCRDKENTMISVSATLFLLINLLGGRHANNTK